MICGSRNWSRGSKQERFSEIILALAADVEGEATTNYLVELLKPLAVTLTRIAHGLPAGGGLESADELTLYQALSGRTKSYGSGCRTASSHACHPEPRRRRGTS